MLKSILKLSGVKTLTKEEQKSVKGGFCGDGCDPAWECCHYCQGSGCVYRVIKPGCSPNCL